MKRKRRGAMPLFRADSDSGKRPGFPTIRRGVALSSGYWRPDPQSTPRRIVGQVVGGTDHEEVVFLAPQGI